MPKIQRRVRGAMISLFAGVSFMSACGGDADVSGWTLSVDTVGSSVRVTNTPPVASAGPTLVALEELRVGDVEGGGPASFGMIRSIAVLPDGRFAVADRQAEEVRVFDGQGRHLRTFGGEGAGPGELKGMQGVFVDHQGLLRVAEQGNARLSVFDPDTGWMTSFPLQLFSYRFYGPWQAAMDSAGRTLVASSGRFGENRYWNMLRVYDPAMTQIDSIPYHDYTDDFRNEDPPGAWRVTLGTNAFTWATVPYYTQPMQVLGPTGEFWSSREGVSHLEVTRWTPPGDTALVLVSRRPPEPVTPTERDSAMAELVSGFATRTSAPPKLDPSRVPATKPPLHGLSLDDGGRLWVRLTDSAADTTVYDVFTPDGRHAETVALPFRVDAWIPPLLRGDVLWAVVTDEMDVQYVVRARLRVAEERKEGA